MESDEKRYMKYYNFRCYEKKHYDLIVDTTLITPEEVSQKILEFIKKKK